MPPYRVTFFLQVDPGQWAWREEEMPFLPPKGMLLTLGVDTDSPYENIKVKTLRWYKALNVFQCVVAMDFGNLADSPLLLSVLEDNGWIIMRPNQTPPEIHSEAPDRI